ncbi:MAG: DNA-directed RNA polymerase subunit beta' [Actinobacteria bacterium]|nr:DNA-directed RNA polymerase subunit beta' [Actinomycetota bacterium]
MATITKNQEVKVDINRIREVKIMLASPQDIRSWSHGEVKKPETINYRTLKPERDGLFCERIFGPVRDYECACGHLKKARFKGMTCVRCGVEVTTSDVRRIRMGHIELAAPVAHIWYYKFRERAYIARILDMKYDDVYDIISFRSYIILDVKEERIKNDLPLLEKELEAELDQLEKEKEREIEKIEEEYQRRSDEIDERIQSIESKSQIVKLQNEKKRLFKEKVSKVNDVKQEYEKQKQFLKDVFERFKNLKPRDIFRENEYELFNEMRDRYGEDYFKSGTGAEAIRDLLKKVDLEEEANKLREEIKSLKGQALAKAVKRLSTINAFLKSLAKPEWMILEVLPVLPPDLRPMVQLDGGRFGSSDLNELYRRVINRNNRLKKMLELKTPELILNNEKRMLQEAVNALIDNSKLDKPITNSNGRVLKSLSDILRGKQGRFRQNLLGKRVDYSGRSVIVVGPELKLHQCGLPKIMALELFKPFVLRRLMELGHAQNIKQAKKMVEAEKPVVWDALEDVIADKVVLLNRAPTLHRLSIQAFEPKLIEGKAIKIHPMVCPPFNADFDGDQMAVHLPLSPKAQAEARILMLSSNNILSPAHGRPLSAPTQDIILGVFYLTADSSSPEKEKGANKHFASAEEAIFAYEVGEVSLRAPIYVRIKDGDEVKKIKTTVGRIIFNKALPEDWPYENREFTKKELYALLEELIKKYSNSKVAETLDAIKEIGFKYATKPGITIGIDDMVVPEDKERIITDTLNKDRQLRYNYAIGFMSKKEYINARSELWNKAINEFTTRLEKYFDKFNPLFIMAFSGARGNIKQIYQLSFMRGLMQKPAVERVFSPETKYKKDFTKSQYLIEAIPEYIDVPITSSFRDGLKVVEYFASTFGARKGIVDTALKTATAGYLTRQFVDVSHDVIITQEDCGTTLGRQMNTFLDAEMIQKNRFIIGRTAAKPVVNPQTGEVIVEANDYIDEAKAEKIWKAGISEVHVRSPFYCLAKHGICQKCYGWALADRKPVELGEAVGIIAAQSIGEPGTQLVMRTFHIGGAGGSDITHGLPKLEALSHGYIKSIKKQAGATLKVVFERKEETRYVLPLSSKLSIRTGDKVEAGQPIDKKEKLIELQAEFSGTVNIDEIPGKKVIRLKSETKKAKYLLSYDADVKVYDGLHVNKGDVIAVSDGKEVKADFDGYVEVEEIIPRYKLIITNEKVSSEYIVPRSTDFLVEKGGAVNKGDIVARFSNEDILADFDGEVEVNDYGERTFINIEYADGTSEYYELPARSLVEVQEIEGQIEPDTVIATVDKDKIYADFDGIVEIEETTNSRNIRLKAEDGSKEAFFVLPKDVELKVKQGDFVEKGEKLVSSPKTIEIKVKTVVKDIEIDNLGGFKEVRIARAGDNIKFGYILPRFTILRQGIKDGKLVHKGEAIADIDTNAFVAEIEGVIEVKDLPAETVVRVEGDGIEYEYVLGEEFNVVVQTGSKVKKNSLIAEANGTKIKSDIAGRVEIIGYDPRKLIKIKGEHLSISYVVPSYIEVLKKTGDFVRLNDRLAGYVGGKAAVETPFDSKLRIIGIGKAHKFRIPSPPIEMVMVEGKYTEIRYNLAGKVLLEIEKHVEETSGELVEYKKLKASFATKNAKLEVVGGRKKINIAGDKEEVSFVLPIDGTEIVPNIDEKAKKNQLLALVDASQIKAEIDGWVEVRKDKGVLHLTVKDEFGSEYSYSLPADVQLKVAPNSNVKKDEVLIEGETIEVKAPITGIVTSERISPVKFIVIHQKQDDLRFEIAKGIQIFVEHEKETEKEVSTIVDTLNKKEEARTFIRYRGIGEMLLNMLNEYKQVYMQEGVEIDDKHFEIIIRQMLKRVMVIDPGDSEYLPGQYVDRIEFAETNARLRKEGKVPARGEIVLLRIIAAAKETDSWLSAASFQETTRVLAEAVIRGSSDYLRGLKENVIIGKLIPAGTGYRDHREVEPKPVYTKEMLDFIKRGEEFLSNKQEQESETDKGQLSREAEAFMSISSEEEEEQE